MIEALRRRIRQRHRRRKWNTCVMEGCYYKTLDPDGEFCFGHTWIPPRDIVQ